MAKITTTVEDGIMFQLKGLGLSLHRGFWKRVLENGLMQFIETNSKVTVIERDLGAISIEVAKLKLESARLLKRDEVQTRLLTQINNKIDERRS